MRLPLKLNGRGWPVFMSRLLRASADPRDLLDADADSTRFSRAVSTLKFGATFKTTGAGRFPRTLAKLGALRWPAAPVVLDVGASDGSTSLDVIRALDFRHYYCTDLNNECGIELQRGWTFFYAADGAPMLAASDRWLAYRDIQGALPPLGSWARHLLARAPVLAPASRRVALINPDLRALRDPRVSTLRYSVLDVWPGERADLVLAANILNRTYFSDTQLERIVGNLRAALRDACGWLVLIDNRADERSSLIEIEGADAQVRDRVGAGSEVEGLALRTLMRRP